DDDGGGGAGRGGVTTTGGRRPGKGGGIAGGCHVPPDCGALYDWLPDASMPIAYTSTSVSRIICWSSRARVWRLGSLPSEITTSAFFRCVPDCAIGMASAIVSYIAVPPRG